MRAFVQSFFLVIKRLQLIGLIAIFVTVLTLCVSCVSDPAKPDIDNNTIGNTFVLCEGLMGANNSSLSLINNETGQINNNYFEYSNPGLKLGDTANDLVLHGDTAYITVTNSGAIESFQVSTGKWLNRLILKGHFPNKTVIVNDSIAYATDLYNDTLLIKYNPKTMALLAKIPFKGKNPVGIACDGKSLFIANSGLGIYAQDHERASTITVIDLASEHTTHSFYVGPNISELIVANNKLYACYYNIYIDNHLGGIVEYNISDFSEAHRIEGYFMDMQYVASSKRLYFIEDVPNMDIVKNRGVSYIDVEQSIWTATQIIANTESKQYWYALGIDSKHEEIIIGNAMNFSVSGQVMIFDMAGKTKTQYPCGVNPTKIVVY